MKVAVVGGTGSFVIALALLPVLLFVTGLQLMDSFKLVRRSAVLAALVTLSMFALPRTSFSSPDFD